jgi:hypothetical protein
MKRIIRITENDLTRIVRRIINEVKIDKPLYLSEDRWVEIWFRLRKLSKSFHLPDYGYFTFGGLFFFYDEEEGCLKLEPQKLSDWREDTYKAAMILDDYAERLENFLKDTGLNLKLEVRSDYSMKIIAFE